jgi:hypothetical protein
MSCGPGYLGNLFNKWLKGRIGSYYIAEHCRWHDLMYQDPRGKWIMEYPNGSGLPTLKYLGPATADERAPGKAEVDMIFFASMIRGITRDRRLGWFARRWHFYITCPLFYVLVRVGGHVSWFKCRWREGKRK